MTVANSLSYRGLALAIVVLATCIFLGCQPGVVEQQRPEPVFFPPLPEKPRLQFLKSFSGPDDLGAVTTSSFEKFVLGEPEKKESISTPYGVAIFDGKIYACDFDKRTVVVLDLRKRTFSYLTKDSQLKRPVNIYIDENGTKYVADSEGGGVFVFDRNDNLSTILGKELNISPMDVVVRGSRCYVTDGRGKQVVVLDKNTGKEVTRIGKKSESTGEDEPLQHLAPGEFSLISHLALDGQENLYVTDMAGGRITEFDKSGTVKRTIGRLGRNIDEFGRPKGIAIDREDRIWVVDSFPGEVVKILDKQAQLLLFFGMSGREPWRMNLPVKVVLDYDNVELFEKYAIEGAKIEFLVLVSNQAGPNKINVYGFGSFPEPGRVTEQTRQVALEPEPQSELQQQTSTPPLLTGTEPPDIGTPWGQAQQDKLKEEIAVLYQSSKALYQSGQLEKAREGFVKVLKSGVIPASEAMTVRSYLADIENRLAKIEPKMEIAELYYRSMGLYRAGQLEEAREGLVKVLNSGLIPPEMGKTIQKYLADIDNALAKRQSVQP